MNIEATNWPDAVVIVVMLLAFAFVYGVYETGRFPWDRE